MSTNCIITFDHPNAIYNSGEVLNGNVKLETVKVKSIRGISIKIVGYASISWHQPSGKHTRYYTAREQYLNSISYVIGSDRGDSFDLTPGIYNYAFSCQLPKELPTTIDIEDAGKVKYEVIVTLDRRLKLDDDFKKEFFVNHISDLNSEPGNKLPRRIYIERHITPLCGVCCCFGGDVKADLEITTGGYISGQTVFYKLNIYNNSNIDLTNAVVKLVKCYIFTSTDPHPQQKEVPQDIAILKKLNQIPRTSRREFKDSFQLPYLTPTHRTKNVRIDYTLQVLIPLGSYSWKKFSIQIPITIGTIPIAGDSIPYNTNLNNIPRDKIPVSSNLNTNQENEIDNIRSYNVPKNNYSTESCINPNDVTIIKSSGGVLNNETCMTYGWN